MGRARQTPIISIDDGMPTSGDKRTSGAQSAGASAVSRIPASAGRIQVEFNAERPELGESTRRLERQSRMETTEPYAKKNGRSVSRVVMYTLLVLVLIAGAFYGGLRASDFIRNRALASNKNAAIDPLQIGREAFERGDYKAAATEFESVLKREPSNARAHYWLGRAQLEQRGYDVAVKSFDEATSRQPLLYDAYVQQAAAYEAMGEKAKAASALSRYAEERRKNERGTMNDER